VLLPPPVFDLDVDEPQQTSLNDEAPSRGQE
jgi:hypothetical protein